MKNIILILTTLVSMNVKAQGTSVTINEIGVTIESTPNSTFIIKKVEIDSPASKVGLKVNDMITSIKKDESSDSVQTAELPIAEIAKLLKGQSGSQLTLKFLRYPAREMKTAILTRSGNKLKDCHDKSLAPGEKCQIFEIE